MFQVIMLSKSTRPNPSSDSSPGDYNPSSQKEKQDNNEEAKEVNYSANSDSKPGRKNIDQSKPSEPLQNLQEEAPDGPHQKRSPEHTKENKGGLLKYIIVALILVVILPGLGLAGFWSYRRFVKPKKAAQLMPHDSNLYLQINADSSSAQAKKLKELLNRFPYFQELYSNLKKKSKVEQDQALANTFKQVATVKIAGYLSNATSGSVLSFVQLKSPQDFKEATEELERLGSDENKESMASKDVFTYKGVEVSCQSLKKENLKNSTDLQLKNKNLPTSKLSISGFESISDQSLCFGYLPAYKLLTFTSSEEGIKDVIKRYKRAVGFRGMVPFLKSKSLAQKKDFVEVKKTWKPDYLINGYVHGDEEIWDKTRSTLSSDTLGALNLPSASSPEENIIATSTLANLGTSLFQTEDNGGESEKLSSGFSIFASDKGVHFDSVRMNTKVAAQSTFSKSGSLANLIGEKVEDKWVDFYFEKASFQDFYNKAKNISQAESGLSQEKNQDQFSQYFGSFFEEEILPLLDNSFALFVSPDFAGKVPAYGALFRVSEQEKMRQILDSAVSEKNLRKEGGLYTSPAMTELNIDSPRLLTSNFYIALSDQVFYLASSKQAVNDLKAEGSELLAENKDYKAQFENLPSQDIKSINYIYTKGIWGLVKSILNQISSLEGKVSREENFEKIEKVMIGYLKVLKTIGSYSYYDQGNLRTKTLVKINALSNSQKEEIKSIIEELKKESGLISQSSFSPLGGARLEARDAARVSDLKMIQTSLELYYSSHREYPERLQDLIEEGYITEDNLKDSQTGAYYCYAWGSSKDTIDNYHLGAKLEESDSRLFAEDKDFDSSRSADQSGVVWHTNSDSDYCPGAASGRGFSGADSNGMFDIGRVGN